MSYNGFDLKTLNSLPIREVVAMLRQTTFKDDGTYTIEDVENEHSTTGNESCFNYMGHTNGDVHKSMQIHNRDKDGVQRCRCYGCGVQGGPLDITKYAFSAITTDKKEQFKLAALYLHKVFEIPFVDGKTISPIERKKPIEKKIVYEKLENRNYELVINSGNEEVIDEYCNTLKNRQFKSKEELSKSVYLYILNFSKKYCNEQAFLNFYKNRGINVKNSTIGFLSLYKIKKLVTELKETFKTSDLIKLKVLNKNGSYFIYGNYNFAVVPITSAYNDFPIGLMLRHIPHKQLNNGKEQKWKPPKEVAMEIKSNLGGLNVDEIKKNDYVAFTEGHIDQKTLEKLNIPNTSIVYVNGLSHYRKEQLGLFEGKTGILFFDQDKAGVKGSIDFSQELIKAGLKKVFITTWDKRMGNDLNDLLKNRHLIKENIKIFDSKIIINNKNVPRDLTFYEFFHTPKIGDYVILTRNDRNLRDNEIDVLDIKKNDERLNGKSIVIPYVVDQDKHDDKPIDEPMLGHIARTLYLKEGKEDIYCTTVKRSGDDINPFKINKIMVNDDVIIDIGDKIKPEMDTTSLKNFEDFNFIPPKNTKKKDLSSKPKSP